MSITVSSDGLPSTFASSAATRTSKRAFSSRRGTRLASRRMFMSSRNLKSAEVSRDPAHEQILGGALEPVRKRDDCVQVQLTGSAPALSA